MSTTPPKPAPAPTPTPASGPDAPDPPQGFARRVLDAEAEAIRRVPLDAAFDDAVRCIVAATAAPAAHGSLVVTGIGKSGHIAAKLSATFASTGTPSHVLNPVEAVHGDLGRIRPGDAVLLLSYSGNTEEVVNLAELLRPDGTPMVAIVGPAGSDLQRLCGVTLRVGDVTEACPNELAPTSSTTAMLALGDALALAVSRAKRFTADQFHKFHPGGGLGRQLMPITHAMRFKVGVNLPLVHEAMPLRKAYELAQPTDKTLRRAGALVVVNDAGKLTGIFTDGDLRRLAFSDQSSIDVPVKDVMTPDPRTLAGNAVVRDAVHLMRETRIDEIPVVDEHHQPLGLIDVQDLVALKVIEG